MVKKRRKDERIVIPFHMEHPVECRYTQNTNKKATVFVVVDDDGEFIYRLNFSFI